MNQICQEIVTVTTTGSAASATGSGTTQGLHGFLLDIFLDYHASAPATTDVTIAYDEPDNGNITVYSDSATDVLLMPRKNAVDVAGAAVSGVYDLYPLNGRVTVSVAGSDALTGCVVARIRYLALG
jgi:hypothetical protein